MQVRADVGVDWGVEGQRDKEGVVSEQEKMIEKINSNYKRNYRIFFINYFLVFYGPHLEERAKLREMGQGHLAQCRKATFSLPGQGH